MDPQHPSNPSPPSPSSSRLATDEGAGRVTRVEAGAAPLQAALLQPETASNIVEQSSTATVDSPALRAPTPPPPITPRSSLSRQSSTFEIPAQLVKPGMEMLKVSAKSARRVKPRRVWLELASETPEDGEMGLEVGIGVVGGQDVRLCWEKTGAGLGFARTPNYASVPLSRIRDLRFAAAGSPYRTSLHLPPSVEPRWATIIYAAPASSRFLGSVTGGPTYKLAHFIALSPHDLGILQKTLEGFKEGRLAKGISHEYGEAEQAADEEDRVVRETEVHQLCARLGMGMSRSEISEAFRKSASPNDFLDFKAFQTFVKLLKRRADIEEIFLQQVPKGRDGLDEQAWSTFLRDVQGVKLDDLAISRGFLKYADATTKTVTLDGFVSFLMSSDNAAIKDESRQDMTRPLPEYFISSSHNTYLIGSQFQGQSTVEGYIRALQQGCRSVELDVWDGDDGEPAVTHGHTLTTKIPVRNVLQAIAQYAFLASPYPVILSVEVHCDVDQQDKLASILHETLGDKLVSRRLDEMEADKDVEHLPSPADLKGKFLLKAKNKFITTSNENGFPVKLSPSSEDSSSSEQSSQSSSDGDFKNSKFYRAIRQFGSSDSSSTRPSILRSHSSRSSFGPAPVARAPSPGVSPSRITETEHSVSPPPMGMPLLSPPALLTKPKDMAMSQALANLLVYTVGVKARGFNKKEKYAPTHVISLGENRLTKMLREEAARQDFVAHNRGHLTRAYPRGSRLTSSNFVPHHMWAAGVQLVALNWQTFDVGMELNLAMFARAGRCGYVLKPDFLRKKGDEKDKIAALRSEKYLLEVEVISAQQLPRSRGSGVEVEPMNLNPFVEVSLFVPGVVMPQRRRTPVVLGNAFNPTFRSHSSSTGTTASSSRFSFSFSSHPSPGMLDLVFVRFEVLSAKGNLKPAMEEGKGDPVGAYTIGVGALMPGYRHLPLYDSMGDQHLYSTLFIRSKIVAWSWESCLAARSGSLTPLTLELTHTFTMPKPTPSPGPTTAPKSSIAEASAFPFRYAALALLLPVALWLYYPPAPAPTPLPNATATQLAVVPEAARCPAQVHPLDVGADWHPEDDAAYKSQAVERLRDAVRIRTEAFDDMGGPEDPRFESFLELHSLLEASYPKVFSSLQVEKVRRHGLLVTWQGTDPSLKPVVLMAHQDVVPVDAITASRWTHPPFSAHLDEDGWIWGRGTTDCKNTLLGALSAFEKLLEDGHQPTRTIIISSGADEEIGGTRSAKYIAERLEERYSYDGVAFILDEGISAIDHAYGLTLARLGIAEKGAVSIKLDVLTPGGHSSVPHGSHTGIGILAKLVTTLEENPELPIMREGSPLLTELQCAADYGRLPPALKASVRDPSRWEALSGQMSAKDNIVRAFIGTTQAVDLIHGGVKINALPEFATASANYRINFLSSVNATLDHLITVLRPTVKSFNLTFDVLGSHADIDNNVVRFSVLPTTAHEPAPLTPTSGPVWELMAATTRHIWKGAVVTPSGMIGGTDTKHCWNLTRHIFRFVPCPLSMALNLHTVDERLHVDAHMSTIRFYHKLIHNLEGWKAPCQPTASSAPAPPPQPTATMGKEESLPLTAPAPSSSSLETTGPSSSFSRRIAALALLLPVAFWLSFPADGLATLPVGRHCRHEVALGKGASCPTQVDPLNVGPDWQPEQDDDYKTLATERLRGAVRIRTESFDDMAGPEDPRFEPFGGLHDYLEKTFPRVYSTLQVEKVQKYGLLLTWKGKDEGLRPVVLMAHQDTVPVPAVTEDRWTYPPFDAHLDENGWIWGRGTADCKNTLIGIFGALDKLIEEGHEPTRTVILSSGFDEEIGGSRSAKYLASTLEKRYGRDGIAWVLDEGFTGVDEAYGRTFARFGTAEKGAVSIKLDVLTPGGHASVPRRGHTGIGILAKLVSVLEEHPDVPRLREGNPLLGELMCAVEYGEVDRKWSKRVKDPKQWKKLGREMADEDDIARAYLSTTQATDLINGGVKINALPEYASASINYRIDFLSSVNATLSRLSSILKPTVRTFNLTFDAYGSHSDVENNVVRLQVIEGSQIEPAPITPTEGPAWELMAGTTRHIWPDAIVGPSGMVANTDTKYSWPLTHNIYRFVPASLKLIKDFHTVDERIHVDAHLNGIRFFYKLLRNTEGWEAP